MRLEGACFKTHSCRVCSQHSVELKPLLINFSRAGTDPRRMILRAKDWEMCSVSFCVCVLLVCERDRVEGVQIQILMMTCKPQINRDVSTKSFINWKTINSKNVSHFLVEWLSDGCAPSYCKIIIFIMVIRSLFHCWVHCKSLEMKEPVTRPKYCVIGTIGSVMPYTLCFPVG